MIIITENLCKRVDNYKTYYKNIDSIIGEKLEVDINFLKTLSVGMKIIIDIERPQLPTGLTIPKNSKVTIDILSGKTIVIQDVILERDNRVIHAGIKASDSHDL